MTVPDLDKLHRTIAARDRRIARGLTTMQETALRMLANANTQNKGPACASDIRCRQVWYVGDVMSRLAKRGYVSVDGKGAASLYTISDEGRAILRALEEERAE